MRALLRSGRPLPSLAVVAALVGGALVGTAPATSAAPRGAGRAVRPAASVGDVVTLSPLQTSADRRFVDAEGRDVLLRGANLNSFGEYWQGVPSIPPTIPATDADYDEMAARGFSVVRLLVTWSRIEPTRGTFDQAYLDQVDGAVTALGERGIYSVIDMHQDAYTAFLHTDDPATCPSGTSPAKGWDGAPAWAVITDGLSTCLTNGERNSSPAVNRAWTNFYDDRDGIRGEFVKAWQAVATRFAGRAEVAGYDLLNEPETSEPSATLKPKYQALLKAVIGGIRQAEAAADAPFDHIVFVEPAIPAGFPGNGLVIPDPKAAGVSTANVSASVHNYAEAIAPGTIEGLNDAIESLTAGLGVPNWGGEYGFWDTSPATLAKVRRYGVDEDAHLWGGAWWQWRQSCGDPHAVSWSGDQVVAPSDVSTHLHALQCPDNGDLGATEAFFHVLSRAYPRAVPGRLRTVVSDPDTGRLKVVATAATAGGQLVVWSPTADDADHPINVQGLDDVVSHEVPGGRLITATVTGTGAYGLWIGPMDEDLTPPTTTTTTAAPATTTDDGGTPGAGGAEPMPGTARYTG